MSCPTKLSLRDARRDLVALLLWRHGEPLSANAIADQWPSIGMRWSTRLDVALRDGEAAGLLERVDFTRYRAVRPPGLEERAA